VFDDRVRGNPADMTERGMADDSSEQVPGQQPDERSREEVNREPGSSNDEPNDTEGLGNGPHAGEGRSG
jgi:hypothetical protein